MRVDERVEPDDEVPFRGIRRHRGALCRKCFFYRQVSEEDEACEAYGKWLVFPQVQRVTCDQYISR